MSAFCALCSQGLDCASDLRPAAWRLLLGVQDVKSGKQSWRQQLDQARKSYLELVDVALSTLSTDATDARHRQKQNETLSRADQMLTETANDVHRTCSAFSFFAQSIPKEQNPVAAVPSSRRCFERLYHLRPFTKSVRRNVDRYSWESANGTSLRATADESSAEPVSSSSKLEEQEELRWESLHRFLYVWSLLNPLGYIQGMCEIAAVLLYVFASQRDKEEAKHAEADAFATFSKLMLGSSSLSDVFNAMEDDPWLASNASDSPNLDGNPMKSSNGLTNVLSTFWDRLWWLDPDLARHLTDEGVEPSHFAIKWFSTLYAQIFDKADILPVFDFLFSSVLSPVVSQSSSSLSNLMETVVDLGCAMIMSISEKLLDATFTLCVSLLQHYECTDPTPLIKSSQLIQERRKAALFAGAAVGDSPQSELRKSMRMSLKDRLHAAATAPSNSLTSAKPSPSGPPQPGIPQQAPHMPYSFSSDSLSAFDSPDPMRTSTNGWFGRKVHAIGDSDMAASLAKSASNLSASTMNWRDTAPQTLSKWTSSAANIGQTLRTSTTKLTSYRAPSPTGDAPFQVPGMAREGSMESNSSSSSTSAKQTLAAPINIVHKPLLLGTSSGSPLGNGSSVGSRSTASTSPNQSRRSSSTSLPSLPGTPIASPGLRSVRSPAVTSVQYVNSGNKHARSSSLAATANPARDKYVNGHVTTGFDQVQSLGEDDVPLTLASASSLTRKRRQASEPSLPINLPTYWQTPDSSKPRHHIMNTSRPTTPASVEEEADESMETLLTSPEASPLKARQTLQQKPLAQIQDENGPASPASERSASPTLTYNVSLEDKGLPLSPTKAESFRRDSVGSTGSAGGRRRKLASRRRPQNTKRDSMSSKYSIDADDLDRDAFQSYAEVIDEYA